MNGTQFTWDVSFLPSLGWEEWGHSAIVRTLGSRVHVIRRYGTREATSLLSGSQQLIGTQPPRSGVSSLAQKCMLCPILGHLPTCGLADSLSTPPLHLHFLLSSLQNCISSGPKPQAKEGCYLKVNISKISIF